MAAPGATTRSPRRRAGQAGTQDAHRPAVRRPKGPPEAFPEYGADLQAEITLLRALIRRVGGMAELAEDLDQAARLLCVLGLAANRLANLLKAQQALESAYEGTQAVLSAGLAAVIKELGLK